MSREELRKEALRCYRRAARLIEEGTHLASFANTLSEAYQQSEGYILRGDEMIRREEFLPLGFRLLKEAREKLIGAEKLRRKAERYDNSYKRKTAA